MRYATQFLILLVALDATAAPQRLGGSMFAERRKASAVVVQSSQPSQPSQPDEDKSNEIDDQTPTSKRWDCFVIGNAVRKRVYGIIIGVVSPTQAEELYSQTGEFYMVKTHKGTPCVVRESEIMGYTPGDDEHFKLLTSGSSKFRPASYDEKLLLPIYVKHKGKWKKLCAVDKDLKSKYAVDEIRRLREIKDREIMAGQEEVRKEYGKWLQLLDLQAAIVRNANPERYCLIHKWKACWAPRFGGDYQTEQIKNEYARNYMEALRAEKEGVIKCTCDDPAAIEKREKHIEAMRLMEQRVQAIRDAYPEIDFDAPVRGRR